MGCWKLNSDASWCDRSGCGGLGWILRRWDGSPVVAGFRFIRRRWKVAWLEALAIVEGLKSTPLTAPKLAIELDSVQVVRLLTGKEEEETELSMFIEEAKTLMVDFQIQAISHVSRRRNNLAHYLAQKARTLKQSDFWSDSFPLWFLEKLYEDLGASYGIDGDVCPTMDCPINSPVAL